MRATTRLWLFGLAMVLAFGAAFGMGRAFTPSIPQTPATPTHMH